MLSLLGVGFISPISYVMQGLQYFMLFTKTTFANKISDTVLQNNGYYNLQTFIGTIDYTSNIMGLELFIAIVGLLFFIVVLVENMCIDKILHDSKRKFIEKTVKQLTIAIKYIFYFTIS
jgi:hypothetical protein